MKRVYPPMLNKIYVVTIRKSPDGDINKFMEKVMDEISNKDNITMVVNAVTVIKEQNAWVIVKIEPWLWQLMLPTMEKHRETYKIDWVYKIEAKT